MILLRDVASVLLVTTGALFFLAGTAGLLRFRDAMSRLHALSKADVTGLGFVVLGLLVRVETWGEAFRLVLIWALGLLAGAIGSQLIGHAEAAPERAEEGRAGAERAPGESR